MLAWLCCGAVANGQIDDQPHPPPLGAGIVATLQMDQDIYTNQSATVWCPPCVTNWPPCMLPCYLIDEKTAVAQFTFQVKNQYELPRTFEFSSGQLFDAEIIDESGLAVAAWSDDKFFMQALTSFTLDPGQTMTFTGEIPLKDRDGEQLNGTYQVRAFLTTNGAQPRVEATTQIAVTVSSASSEPIYPDQSAEPE
jgi:hypothetical protein